MGLERPSSEPPRCRFRCVVSPIPIGLPDDRKLAPLGGGDSGYSSRSLSDECEGINVAFTRALIAALSIVFVVRVIRIVRS